LAIASGFRGRRRTKTHPILGAETIPGSPSAADVENTMRCLFVADEPDHFMDVAAALDAAHLATSAHRSAHAAGQAIHKGRYRIIVIGTDSYTSESMTFMHRLRDRSTPVLAATHDPKLRGMLLDLGAERVVVLPEQEGKLKFALETLLGQSAVSKKDARSGVAMMRGARLF
jgi:DNA-binding response OmpR family regulator